VSPEFRGHGERTVVVDGGDGPEFAVADRFAGVVVSRRSLRRVTTTSPTMGVLAAGDRPRWPGSRWPASSGRSGRRVDGVDVVVGRRGDRDRVAGGGGVEPGVDDASRCSSKVPARMRPWAM
jgi:hypothetical protein